MLFLGVSVKLKMDTKLPLILIGAGGHAKVLLSLLELLGCEIIGVCDPHLTKANITAWRGIPVLADDSCIDDYSPAAIGLVNAVGQKVNDPLRKSVYLKFKQKGYYFPQLIHPFSFVDKTVILDEGVQIMAGAVVQPDVAIGANTIINSRSIIEHDCVIGDHVHIAPGASLCGQVFVRNQSFIGAGATIIQNIQIGENALIGAGVSVVRNVFAGQRILPAAVRIESVVD